VLASLLSATLHGLDGRAVRVEVDVAPGLPGFTIVGLADTGLQEARERVRGAIRNSGYEYPPRRITVNLAPADLRKSGASLDLAIALGMAACAQGYRVRFHRLTELATLLLEARDERSLLSLKARLAKLDLLILDELGYVPASKIGAELLFDVISSAYERTSLIVTTNLPFESWTEVLGSERLTGATLDRLTHRCQIIETKGES